MVSNIIALISSLLQYSSILTTADYGPTLSFSSKSDSARESGVFKTFLLGLFLFGLFLLEETLLLAPDLAGGLS